MKHNGQGLSGWILRGAIAGVMSGASLAVAQVENGPQIGINPPVPDAAAGKDLQSVYVRDSGVATEKLALAERMERLKEWGKSADVYQEIVEKFSDRVVPSKSDSKQVIVQYASVALVVQEKLAHWPKEGLDFYRSRYEDTARDQLGKAGSDPRLLGQVFGLYFVTDAGRDAGLRLVHDNFERGEFSGAAWAGHRLLSLHPNLGDERPRLVFLTGLCDLLAGNAKGAKDDLAELKNHYAEIKAPVAGREVVLADELSRQIETPSSLSRTYHSDSWPMAFGTLDRAAVPSGVVTSGAKLFSVELPSLLPKNLNRQQAKTVKAQFDAERKKGLMTGIMPVIDRGELFFTDNVNVFAYSLQSGQPLPGWAATYPGAKRGYFSAEGWPMARQVQSCVAVDDRAVYAIVGQSNSLFGMMYLSGSPTSSQIVCLDRVTGKRLWGMQAAQLKLPGDAQQAQPQPPVDMGGMQNAMLYGSPMVVGDTVYVMLRSWKGGQFEEVNVAALSAGNGEMKWCSYVASSATNTMMNQFVDDEGSPGGTCMPAHLAYADGRLYAQTNLGALGCLDAADGKVFWLNIYSQGQNDSAKAIRNRRVFINRPAQRANDQRAFAFNPVIVADGRVITTPVDSPYLYIYDASTGEILKEIPRRLSAPQNAANGQDIVIETVLGIVNGELFVASRDCIVGLPLATYDPTKSLDANNARYLTFEAGSNEYLGRPLLTDTHILYTTAHQLKAINLKRWRLESVYPSEGDWSPDEQPGNLVATPEHLVVAGASRVTVYTDLNLARKRIDESIAQSPTDPAPQIRAAEIYYAAGRTDEATTHLDQAIDLLGGRTAMAGGAMRDRVFDCVLTNAIKFSQSTGKAKELAGPMFDRARDAASSPTQQATYRLQRANAAHNANDLEGELALLQELLASADARKAPAVLDAALPSAGAEAEKMVARVMSAKPDLYKPFEDAAAQQLATATDKNDVEGLISVADQFPNSRASSMALLTASEKLEDAGQSRTASLTFRRALKRATSDEARGRILEGLARASVQSPDGLDLAIARLEQVAKITPSRPLSKPISFGPDKVIEKVSVKEAAAALKAFRSASYGQELPLLDLPTSSDTTYIPAGELQKVMAIVLPDRGRTRADRVVVWTTDKQISVLEAGSVTPTVSGIAFPSNPMGCAWTGDQLVVYGLKQIICIDTKAGKLAWEKSLTAMPGVAASDESAPTDKAEGDAGEMARQVIQRAGNQLIIRQAGGGIRVVNMNAGVNIPNDASPPTGGEEVFQKCKVLSDRVVACTSTGRVVSFDLDKGDLSWQVRPDDNGYAHFRAIDDFVVVASVDATGSSELIVIDATSGQIVRRKTYDPSVQPNAQLTNIALSNDGWLVVALPDRLSGYNLFDTTNGERPAYERTIARGAGMDVSLSASVNENQMQISDGRLMVLCYANMPQQHVLVFDLKTGEPATVQERNRQLPQRYSPKLSITYSRGNTPAVQIRMIGPTMYLYSTRSLIDYHLDKPEQQASPLLTIDDSTALMDLLISRDAAIAVQQVKGNSPDGDHIKEIQLNTYSRALTRSGIESFALTHNPIIRDPNDIRIGQWQLVNGGFYYVSNANELKFNKSAKNPDK